jgi:hypothetical protein
MGHKAENKDLVVNTELFSTSKVTFNHSVEELQSKKFAKDMKDRAAAALHEETSELIKKYYDSYLNPRRLRRQT